MKFEKDPGPKYRSVPFWSLNGKLDASELREQIRILKDMGFGGVFVHSRTGLRTEYMSDEWLRLVAACADECYKQGMDVWLYDEDRWPSGTCGGYVTEDPRYRLRFISADIKPREQFDLLPYGDEFLGAFAIKIVGDEYKVDTDGMPEFSGMKLADYFPIHNRFDIPDGYLGMTFKVELMRPEEFYNGFTYADTMNAEATERFIELTHEKYRKALGDKFGKSIKGIFTDEPHRGALLSHFGIANENALRMVPFTDELPDAYFDIWEEEILDQLPELYFAPEDDDFSRVMWQYVETMQQLFVHNFAMPINEWCKENGIVLTGHILHEDTLSAQASLSGSVMRFYEHMGYPGLDNLGTDNTCFQAAIAVSSVAKQTGKPFVLSELYGCSGWKTTFLEYKQMGDWQAAMGVNLRCPHLSWYTMQGEAKRDYPASINKQADWHREYRAVEDYFARIGSTLSQAKTLTDTLVIMPVESAWGLTHMGTYVNCWGVRDMAYRKLEDDFRALTEALVYAGVDFDYGDEDMMYRLGKVGSDKDGAFIRVGKMKYRRVVLPYMITVRSSTLLLVSDFADIGGKVIAVNHVPTHIDGIKARIKSDLAVLDIDEAAEELAYGNNVRIESCGKFFGSFKKAASGEFVYFVVNADRKKGAHGKIILKGIYNAEKFDLRSGDTVGIAFKHENGNTVIEYDFDRSEELLLHFTKQKVALPVKEKLADCEPLGAPIGYRLDRPNVLVLDRAKAYADGEFVCEDEMLRIDELLRKKFGLRMRSGNMIQPWFREKFSGEGYESKKCSLRLEFAFDAEFIPDDARLMVENYDKISVNGQAIGGESTKSDIDVCYTLVKVSAEVLREGRNEIAVECDFADSFDIENMFLLGSFGVKAGNPCLMTKLPKTLTYGDVCTQGLPFYAGGVSYIFECKDGDYEASVPEYYGACLKSAEGICAFAPDKLRTAAKGGKLEITAVLTPKNMFGPLHELPALTYSSGPWNYHTSGDNWSDDYALLPQGIFAPVKIRKLSR